MSNGQACCLLGVCCPPAAQTEHIVEHLTAEGMPEDQARKAGEWFTKEIRALGDLEAAVKKMKKANKAKGGG
jgi:hypothetical protein